MRNFVVINLRALLDEKASMYIGEEAVKSLLSDFSCPQNPDVEKFLQENAAQFTRKHQSVTYLVMDELTGDLVGYYALAVKPVSIPSSSVSRSMMKRLDRVSIFDEKTQTYTTAAYLIAQLGKNYRLSKNAQINGSDLLKYAMATVSNIQYELGGVVQFLECEDNPFLLEFYKKNSFKVFDARMTEPISGEPHKLYQLLKRID